MTLFDIGRGLYAAALLAGIALCIAGLVKSVRG